MQARDAPDRNRHAKEGCSNDSRGTPEHELLCCLICDRVRECCWNRGDGLKDLTAMTSFVLTIRSLSEPTEFGRNVTGLIKVHKCPD